MGEGGNRFMTIGAEHNPIHKAREHFGGIFNRFAAPYLHIITGRRDGRAAQLAHGHVKTKPRTCGGFFKNQGEGFPFKRGVWVKVAFGQVFTRRFNPVGFI